ncbi:MAG: hypothetical protein JSS65_06280 [Armatimonadetes bacterium]|nr:hypothetical protein [Armatimonadota bacterium]
MKPPSKKQIREALEKLRSDGGGGETKPQADNKPAKLSDKKSSQRIRKKGV